MKEKNILITFALNGIIKYEVHVNQLQHKKIPIGYVFYLFKNKTNGVKLYSIV